MTLHERLRDVVILHQTRLVRVGNAAARALREPMQELAMRWSIEVTHLVSGERVSPIVARRAADYAASVVMAGMDAFTDAYDRLRLYLTNTAIAQHEMMVRLLRRELRRAFREEVDPQALRDGSAVVPLSVEMAEVIQELDINGLTLPEIQSEALLKQSAALTRTFRTASLEGWTVRELTAQIMRVADVSRQGAETMARTGILRVSNEVNRRLYRNNRDIVREWEYIATLDDRTCLICASDDRRRFPVGEGPSLPRHPRCRCVEAPVTRSWRELGVDADEISPATRASATGYVAGETSYAGWLARQSADKQLEILGAARFKLYRGGTPITRFTDDGRILTLDALRRRGIGD